jgi:hypothetical protein
MWRLVLMFSLLAAMPGAAQECPRPAAPACVGARVPFIGESDFDACRKEMIAFRDAMDQRASCLAPKSAADEKAARDEYEEVRVRFNKRARGEID